MTRIRVSREGFSLIEVVVAMLVLALGVLGLTAGTGWVLRSTEVARVDGARAVAVQSAVERVRAVPYAELADGGAVDLSGGFSVTWSRLSQNPSGQSSQMQIIVSGPGRTGQVAGPGAQLSGTAADTVLMWVTRP